ncbi:hypothetical protein JCM3774_001514 [Rhodotorula dairenensis]
MNQHRGKGKEREHDDGTDDTERFPGLSVLESDNYQRLLLETFHNGARARSDSSEEYFAKGLDSLFELQGQQMSRRPEMGRYHAPWPPDLRKSEQRIGYLGALVQYLDPANYSGRYGDASRVPKTPWATEPANYLIGFGRTGDSLDLCDSDSDSGDNDHVRLQDRHFYPSLFYRRLSPRGLQELKRGAWDALDEMEDEESVAADNAESAGSRSSPDIIQDPQMVAGQQDAGGTSSYGGGFEQDWSMFAEDVPDLGIGTSKNPPPPPPPRPAPPSPAPLPPVQRPAKKQKLDRPRLGKAAAPVQTEAAMKDQPIAPLEKITVVTDDEDAAPAPGPRRLKRKKRKVYKTRTSFANAVRRVRAPNPLSEDRLDERFPLDLSSSADSTERSRQRTQRRDDDSSDDESEEDEELAGGARKNGGYRDYSLRSFRALRTKRETQASTIHTRITSTPIDLVEVILRDHTDFVVIGLASPLPGENDDIDARGEDEHRRSTTPFAGVGECAEELEVYLYGHEVRSTRLTSFGITLETASRRFHFLTPATRPLKSAIVAGTPYDPHVVRARRLLNLYAFSRAHAIRGDFLQPSADEEARREAVEEMATQVVDALKAVDDAGDWQTTLPFAWRIERAAIRFHDEKDKEALFRLLPNIPFLVPSLYRHIEPFFPPNSFRTDEPERRQIEIRDAARAETERLEAHRRIVVEDEAIDDLGRVEPCGDGVSKRSPVANQDADGYQQNVTVYDSAIINGIRYSPGDVVHLRADRSPGKTGPRVDPSKTSSSRRTRFEKGKDPGSDGEVGDPELWYGLVKYFFETDEDDPDLQVHVVWFAVPNTIPSLGIYLPPRQLLLLDLCDSFAASSILHKVDFAFPEIGAAAPSRGMYCMFSYNYTDGSCFDVCLDDLPAPKCRELDIVPCSACENAIKYYRATTDDGSGIEPRPERAVYDLDKPEGPMFSLDSVDYHSLDTVYLLPKDPSEIVPPALPAYELGQLIAQDEVATQGKNELYVRVRRIVRVNTLSLGSEREVRFTDGEIPVPAVNIAGKFNLVVIPNKPTQAQVGRIEASSPHAFWTLEHNVPQCRDCHGDFEAWQAARAQAAASGAKAELSHLALYSGGGLLDLGLERGCPLLKTKVAVEQHAPAAECLSANVLEPVTTIVNSVSNAAEELYFGAATDLPKPGSLFSIAGGSPCQGFSQANRYKKTDDTRTFEPFVFLNFVALYRPLHVVFENVATFTRHALPKPGSERGSFFKLFVSVLLGLGYQLRWQVVDAAGFGVPQSRRRVIVQAAARGVLLPKAPKPTHSLLRAVQHFDHRRKEHQAAEGPLEKTINWWAPHAAVTAEDAFSDLPAFTAEQDEHKGLYGIQWSSAAPPKYAKDAHSTFQRCVRISFPVDPKADTYHNAGVTYHVCRSTSEQTQTRLKWLQLRDDAKGTGCHNDLLRLACYPVPPPWVTRKQTKLRLWWRRLLPTSVLAPLRTKLNLDGASHGERIHYSQNRPLSCRELLRAQGVPDWYELLFSADIGEEAFDEWLRIIGNGVPVPLAAAYGDTLFDSLLPLVKSKGTGNVWAKLWEETGGRALCARRSDESMHARRLDLEGEDSEESVAKGKRAVAAVTVRSAMRTKTSSSSTSSTTSSLLATTSTPISMAPVEPTAARVPSKARQDSSESSSDIELVPNPNPARLRHRSSTAGEDCRSSRVVEVLELSSDTDSD